MLPDAIVQDRDSLERVSRQGCQMVRISESHILCRVLGKYIVYADAADISVAPHLCMNGYWESWITVAMARLLRPGWYCLDVGANHGYYTLIMADAVGEGGRVLALEPNPRLADTIRLSLEVNGMNRCASVFQGAASDSRLNAVRLVVPPNRGGMATLYRQPNALDEVINVETTTIDELTAEWPHLDFIKIDAEGAEEGIWRGMQQTIQRHRNIRIMMEFCAARYANPGEFVASILRPGFRLCYVDFDATVRSITEQDLLTLRPGEEWMLFLERDDQV